MNSSPHVFDYAQRTTLSGGNSKCTEKYYIYFQSTSVLLHLSLLSTHLFQAISLCFLNPFLSQDFKLFSLPWSSWTDCICENYSLRSKTQIKSQKFWRARSNIMANVKTPYRQYVSIVCFTDLMKSNICPSDNRKLETDFLNTFLT